MLFDVVLERGASVATPFRDPGHLTVNRVLSSGDSLGHLRFTQPLTATYDKSMIKIIFTPNSGHTACENVAPIS